MFMCDFVMLMLADNFQEKDMDMGKETVTDTTTDKNMDTDTDKVIDMEIDIDKILGSF
jgi:hypothetical protein